MKDCPKCGAKHEKKGRFCSKSCAQSRNFTPEQRAVYAQKQKEYLKTERGQNQKRRMEEAASDYAEKKSEESAPPVTEYDTPFDIVRHADDVFDRDNDNWEEVDGWEPY